MLLLSEELLLLSLHEKKETIRLPYTAALPYGLAGAMLMELVFIGGISLDKNKKILPIGDTQDKTEKKLNELLIMIQRSGNPKKITYWINTIVGKGKKLEKTVLAEMIDRGILQKEEKRILWVIPFSDYSKQEASVKYQLKHQLRDIVLGGKPPDQRSLALLSLLRAIELLHHIFTIDEIKAADIQVKSKLKNKGSDSTMSDCMDSISSATASAALTALSNV